MPGQPSQAYFRKYYSSSISSFIMPNDEIVVNRKWKELEKRAEELGIWSGANEETVGKRFSKGGLA